MNLLIFYLLLLNISQIFGRSLWDFTLRPEKTEGSTLSITCEEGSNTLSLIILSSEE